jgi:branched-subunit amino acid ABC-type transport system permease component
VREDWVTADVSNSLRPGAQAASDRSARRVPLCVEGVVVVRVALFVARARVGSRVAVVAEYAVVSDVLGVGVELTRALTVVEFTAGVCAAGAGSGWIGARACVGGR